MELTLALFGLKRVSIKTTINLKAAKFGLVMLVIGMAYLLIAVPFLIPSRTVTSSLTKSYHMGGYLTELKVSAKSPLVGRTCKERAVNKNYDITVLDILRDGKLISKNIRACPRRHECHHTSTDVERWYWYCSGRSAVETWSVACRNVVSPCNY